MSLAQGKKKWRLKLLMAMLVALAALFGWMIIEANVIHVEFADVYLEDLPEAFQGTRILYLSDLHVSNLCPPDKAAALVNQLQPLQTG